MSPEAIGLALASALRPTGLAAVYALLSAPRPARMLAAYVVVGFAWSCAIGVVVVSVLHGVGIRTGSSTAYAVIELIGGGAALGFAAGMGAGKLTRERESSVSDSRLVRRLRDPSPSVAALAISVRRPEAARRALERVAEWMRRHQRPVLVAAFAVVGAYFTIKGVLDLTD